MSASLFYGGILAAGPIVGMGAAYYLGQPIEAGAALGVLGEYLLLDNANMIGTAVAAGSGIYLAPYMPGGGLISNALGALAGGTLYTLLNAYLNTPGGTGISTPTY